MTLNSKKQNKIQISIEISFYLCIFGEIWKEGSLTEKLNEVKVEVFAYFFPDKLWEIQHSIKQIFGVFGYLALLLFYLSPFHISIK